MVQSKTKLKAKQLDSLKVLKRYLAAQQRVQANARRVTRPLSPTWI